MSVNREDLGPGAIEQGHAVDIVAVERLVDRDAGGVVRMNVGPRRREAAEESDAGQEGAEREGESPSVAPAHCATPSLCTAISMVSGSTTNQRSLPRSLAGAAGIPGRGSKRSSAKLKGPSFLPSSSRGPPSPPLNAQAPSL